MGRSNGAAEVARPYGSSLLSSYILSNLACFTEYSTSKSGAGDPCPSSSGAAIAPRHQSYSAKAASHAPRSPTPQPRLVPDPYCGGLVDLPPLIGTHRPQRHHKDFNELPPQRRTSFGVPAAVRQKVDAATAEVDVFTFEPANCGSSASTFDGRRTSLNFAPFTTTTASPTASTADSTPGPNSLSNGCHQSPLSRTEPALAKASVNRTADGREDRIRGAALSSDNPHDCPARLSSSHPCAMNSHHHHHRYENAGEPKCIIRSDADLAEKSHRARRPTNASTDPPKATHHLSPLSRPKRIVHSAGVAPPQRHENLSHIPPAASSMGAGTRDSTAVSLSITARSASEMCARPLKSLPRSVRTAPENRTECLNVPPSGTSHPRRASHEPTPSVRLFYTRSASGSKARSSENITDLEMPASQTAPADSTCAVAAAIVSTKSATTSVEMGNPSDKGVAVNTITTAAPEAQAGRLRPGHGTSPRQRPKREVQRLSQTDRFTCHLLTTSVCPGETSSAARSPHKVQGRTARQKCSGATKKDVGDVANKALRPTCARSSQDPSQSCLQRWRQRQEENAAKVHTAPSNSVLATLNAEIDTTTITRRDALVKNEAGAAPNDDIPPPLRSVPETSASWRHGKMGVQRLASAADSVKRDLVIAPQTLAAEAEGQHTPPFMADSKNHSTVSTSSDYYSFLSEVGRTNAEANTVAVALPSLRTKRRSEASSIPLPQAPPTVHSPIGVNGPAPALTSTPEVQADNSSHVSTCPLQKKSPLTVYLAEDRVDRAVAEGCIPVGPVRQSSSSPPLRAEPTTAITEKSPRQARGHHTIASLVLSTAGEDIASTTGRSPNRSSTHEPACRIVAQQPTATVKESAAPYLSVSGAKRRDMHRTMRECREKRTQPQDYLKTAGRASPRLHTPNDVHGRVSRDSAEVLSVPSGLNQSSPSYLTATTPPSASPGNSTQGKAELFPLIAASACLTTYAARTMPPKGPRTPIVPHMASPTAAPGLDECAPRSNNGASAETLVESPLPAHLMNRDTRGSASATETAVEEASHALTTEKRPKGNQLDGFDFIRQPPAEYTSLSEPIRLDRTQSYRTSIVTTPLASVDVEAGLDTVPATGETEQDVHHSRRRALVNKYRPPSSATSDAELNSKKTRIPGADASRQTPRASLPPVSEEAYEVLRNDANSSMLCIPPSVKREAVERHLTPTCAHPLGQAAADGRSTPKADPAQPPDAPRSTAPADTNATSFPTTFSLCDIQLDDLDKLEESVDALLRNYSQTKETRNESTPGSVTLAEAIVRAMPPPDNKTATTNAMHEVGMRTSKAPKKKETRLHCDSGDERPGMNFYQGARNETDDDDSWLEGSRLWCGDEPTHEAKPPPVCVPPLDLTHLLRPTSAPNDLQQYRIPLPSAVPNPEGAHQQFLRTIGTFSVALDKERTAVKVPNSPNTGPTSETKNAFSPLTTEAHSVLQLPSVTLSNSSRTPPAQPANNGSMSLGDFSPLVNARIGQLQASRQRSSCSSSLSSLVTYTAAAQCQNAPHSEGGSLEASANRATSQPVSLGNAAALDGSAYVISTEDKPKNPSREEVGSTQPSTTRVAFLAEDSGHTLTWGRRAEHDTRVRRQCNRVQRTLLCCQEQHKRKEILLEETSAFDILIMPFHRHNRYYK